MSWSIQVRGQNAFTLIELIASIAIIAILVVILLLTVTKAKKKGSDAVCLNNLRQLSVGLSEFVNEHGEYPLDGTLSMGFFTWQRAVNIKLYGPSKAEEYWPQNLGVWNCPGVKKAAYDPKLGPFYDYGYNSFGVGTKTNSFGLSGEDSASFKPVTEADIAQPSSMISIGDGFWGGGGAVGDGVPRLQRVKHLLVDTEQTVRTARRHNRKAVTSFVDGHVELLPFHRLFGSDQDETLSWWNRDNKSRSESLK